MALTRSSGSVRLTADGQIDEGLLADRARAHLLDRTTPGTAAAIAVILSAAPSGATSVSVSMVRRPSRQPATQTSTATTKRGGRVRPRQSEAHADEPDQHRKRRPRGRTKNAARRPRAPGLRSSWRCATARANGRNRPPSNGDDAEGPGVGIDHRAFMLRQPLDRFPDHDAREQKQQRGLRQRRDGLELADGRIGAPRRPACRKCALRA